MNRRQGEKKDVLSKPERGGGKEIRQVARTRTDAANDSDRKPDSGSRDKTDQSKRGRKEHQRR